MISDLSTYYVAFLQKIISLCAYYARFSTYKHRIRDAYGTRDRTLHRHSRSFKKQARQGAPQKARRRRCFLRQAAFEEQRRIWAIYCINIASPMCMGYKTIMLIRRKFARQGVRAQGRRRCSYLLRADRVARQRSIADFIQSAYNPRRRKSDTSPSPPPNTPAW